MVRSCKKFFTPPTYALFIGCIVALTPLKKLFYYDGTSDALFPDYPSISPPLSVITEAIESLANAGL